MGIDIAAERRKKEVEKKKQQATTQKEALKSNLPPNKPVHAKFICTQCGTTGKPKLITKGNILVELALWVIGIVTIWFFIFPILIPIAYSMWRHLSRTKGCKQCHGQMIKTDSPMGRSLMEKMQVS